MLCADKDKEMKEWFSKKDKILAGTAAARAALCGALSPLMTQLWMGNSAEGRG